jgi:hypothetical protein
MLERSPRRARRLRSQRIRAARYRGRQRAGRRCWTVERNGDVVTLLVKNLWLREADACDDAKIAAAISAMLRDAAKI